MLNPAKPREGLGLIWGLWGVEAGRLLEIIFASPFFFVSGGYVLDDGPGGGLTLHPKTEL